jgi:hypothetical protein
MPLKSKYNLHRFKHLKVPMDIVEKYVKEYGWDKWAEQARHVLDLATGAFKSE